MFNQVSQTILLLRKVSSLTFFSKGCWSLSKMHAGLGKYATLIKDFQKRSLGYLYIIIP